MATSELAADGRKLRPELIVPELSGPRFEWARSTPCTLNDVGGLIRVFGPTEAGIVTRLSVMLRPPVTAVTCASLAMSATTE